MALPKMYRETPEMRKVRLEISRQNGTTYSRIVDNKKRKENKNRCRKRGAHDE